jgi:ADP-ribose pyrophosphatase
MIERDPAPWQTQATHLAFQNRWVTVAVDDVVLPTGQHYEYTRVQFNGVGVAMVGFNPAGEILLEREYRHGVGQVIWQLPGGLATPGEDLQQAGLRELREETGYAPALANNETVRYLGRIWNAPAQGASCCHLFAAWGLMPTQGTHFDPAEFLVQQWVSPTWLKEAVRRGEIQDYVTVAAVAHLLLNGWL